MFGKGLPCYVSGFSMILKSSTDRFTASSTIAAMIIRKIFSGIVIKLLELPFVVGGVGVNVEVGAKVVDDVGFGVEVEIDAIRYGYCLCVAPIACFTFKNIWIHRQLVCCIWIVATKHSSIHYAYSKIKLRIRRNLRYCVAADRVIEQAS